MGSEPLKPGEQANDSLPSLSRKPSHLFFQKVKFSERKDISRPPPRNCIPTFSLNLYCSTGGGAKDMDRDGTALFVFNIPNRVFFSKFGFNYRQVKSSSIFTGFLKFKSCSAQVSAYGLSKKDRVKVRTSAVHLLFLRFRNANIWFSYISLGCSICTGNR